MTLSSALWEGKGLQPQQVNALAWLAVAFAVGIALYFALRFEPPAWPTLAVLSASSGSAFYLWPKRYELFTGFILTLLIAFLSAGFFTAQLRAQAVYTPMIVKKTGPVMIEGVIHRIDMMDEGADMRVVLRGVKIEDIASADTPISIRLRVKKGEGLMPGQRIKGLGALNPPSPPVAPGAFDFQRQAYFERIGAVGFFYRPPEIIASAGQGGLKQTIEEWRLKIAARVSTQFNQPQAGLIIALMTGQQKAVSEEDYQALRDSGLAHLLAISGMNVGMIAISLFFISRLLMAAVPWFALHYPIKKIAAVIAFIGALLYTMIAGFSVPTQRAIFMTGIALLAILYDRSPFSLRLLAFSAFIILVTTPENLIGVSFQMSFAAVAALIIFYDWARPFWTAAYSRAGWFRRGILYLLGVLVTTVIGGTVTGLFSLHHFQTFALYNIFANMLAVPLSGVVIMPCAVAAMVLMPFGLEGWALEGMAWGVTWMLAIARWVAGLDGAVLRVTAFSPVLFSAIVLSSGFFLLWQGRARLIGLIMSLILVCAIPFARTPDVLVNGEASLIAVKNDSGRLNFSSGRGDGYAAETWLRRNGEIPEQKRMVWLKEGREGWLSCDAAACRFVKNGQQLSLLRLPGALREECAWAHLVIADFPIEECRARTVDRFDVWRHGAHALYLDKEIHIRTVEEGRGQRPWTQTAAKLSDRSASD